MIDGSYVANSKILELAKVSQSEFIDKCQSAVTDFFDKVYTSEYKRVIGYNQARSNTINKDNFSLSKTQAYLNDNGELSIVATIYTLAGVGKTEKLINLENFSKNILQVAPKVEKTPEGEKNTVENETIENETIENENIEDEGNIPLG